MNDAHLPLTFSVSPADTLDTLEAVLAIARRGGLRLASMQVRQRANADQIFLDLRAGESALLDLFLARLRNLVCVADIVVRECAHGSHREIELNQTHQVALVHTECLCRPPTMSP